MGNVDWKSLEGKYFKVDVGSTTAEALSGGDNSVIYYTTDGNVVLNGQVFGGGCLDLGLVSSDDAGCAEAAKSEVAGNRQITMIRFRVRGVTSEKVTVIWQWCNGVDVCAQLKFVDKSVWRRNVTGATGVAGATTSASQWERTWAHYLGYDAANRKIQLKDYNQTVFRDVQLPLATETQAGLMSADDKLGFDKDHDILIGLGVFRPEVYADDVEFGIDFYSYADADKIMNGINSTRSYNLVLPNASSTQAGGIIAEDYTSLMAWKNSGKAKLDMRANVREKCYGFNVKGVKNGATYDASAVPWSQADMKAWSKSSNGIFPLFFIPGSGGGNMYRPVSVEVYAWSTKMVFVFDTGIVVQNWQYNSATSKWTVTVTTL
ncbi:MAG: hypothetical protein SOV62_00405 [Alloprevotella sp.]|nr:hypothetical protein [Alloprevotella sp.]